MVEKCDLCSVTLPVEHAHLLALSSRKIVCACTACALLFDRPESKRFRRIPTAVSALPDFHLSDAEWDALDIPVGMAFFSIDCDGAAFSARYPSPGGTIESKLPLSAWAAISAANPCLSSLEPGVEALLVNRTGREKCCYRVPIDECFRLVGILRTTWKGFSGGREAEEGVAGFFERLRERAGAAS